MKETYIKSLQLIRKYDIKDKKEYIKIAKEYDLLSIIALKYMSGIGNFDDLIKKVKEVA